jgi:phosphatidylglycerol:prolipoprotein diacylglycerol transferase
MRQILFTIPFKPFEWLPDWWPHVVPIYGFGMMLFITFLVTTWLAARRARQEGIAPQYLQDLAIWIFVGGIVGARVVYMVQYGQDPLDFFKIWQGGLVFYGSAIGGVAGYLLAYFLVIRKHGLSTWKLADIIAPSVAVGLLLGRVGCLLNGCCYGNVACTHCPGVSYPLSAPARYMLVRAGYQTAAGFTLVNKDSRDSATVAAVEPGSPASQHGLRAGDVIIQANDRPIHVAADLDYYLGEEEGWPRGKAELKLTVLRPGEPEPVELAAFVPWTLKLHPTQVYESISMALLFLLLTAYYPFRRRDGMVMVLFILGYSVHRFLNEVLRNDTDPVAFGMTLSQNGSILFFVLGLVFLVWLWRQPAQLARRA